MTATMMIEREILLKPLQLVSSIIEQRQTLPILANVLLSVNGQIISLVASDSEIELLVYVKIEQLISFPKLTVAGKKLLDIISHLPDKAQVKLVHDDNYLSLSTKQSRFNLTTLPAEQFPHIAKQKTIASFSIESNLLLFLLKKSYFCMALKDLRHYFNGLLLEINSNSICIVATDGHRLALAKTELQLINSDGFANNHDQENISKLQFIIPRKAVLELIKLLQVTDNAVQVVLSDHDIRVKTNTFIFISKLIGSKFPDYKRIIPRESNKKVVVHVKSFFSALSRVAILSNEQQREVRLVLYENYIKIFASNFNSEHAEEMVNMVNKYNGEEMELGFKVNYLMDILSSMDDESNICISFSDINHSFLFQQLDNDNAFYVMMPMRL